MTAAAVAAVLAVTLVPVASAEAAVGKRFLVGLEPGHELDEVLAEAGAGRVLAAGAATVLDAPAVGDVAVVPAAVAHALADDPRVRYVEPDHVVTTTGNQSGPPKGLDRVDQRDLPLDDLYTYAGTGEGVRVYVVDTGVRASHVDLAGRVDAGFDAVGGGPPADCNGHGTHVAGTVAGTWSGVAKAATVVPVRVLDCEGSGYLSQVIAGIEWAVADSTETGDPTVMNLSLGLEVTSQSMARAVEAAHDAGVVVVAAAGNDNVDACTSSPGDVPEAITVAASDPRTDERADFSNHGSCVDVFAPGVDIVSAVHVSDTAMYSLDGTSMAAPHVAGIAALHLQADPKADPETVTDVLLAAATPKRVTDRVGSPDLLAYSGLTDPDPDPAPDPDPNPDPDPDPRAVVERVAGGNRVATSVAVSQDAFPHGAPTVVVARSDDYADALAGATLATARGGPLLLTGRTGLHPQAAAELTRLGATRAVLLGAEAALSGAVASDLVAAGLTVERIGGADRYDTAARVAAAVAKVTGGYDEVFVVEGRNANPGRGWPDAVSASGVAAATGAPVLLTTRDRLPDATAAALRPDVAATIVGGESAVSSTVRAAIRVRTAGVRRLAGADRYDTSAKVAADAVARGLAVDTVWVATGRNWPDALAAGSVAGAAGGTVLLVDGTDLDRSPVSRDWLAGRAPALRHLRVAGGPAAVSDQVLAGLQAAAAR